MFLKNIFCQNFPKGEIFVPFWFVALCKMTTVFQAVLEQKNTCGNQCLNNCATYIPCLQNKDGVLCMCFKFELKSNKSYFVELIWSKISQQNLHYFWMKSGHYLKEKSP